KYISSPTARSAPSRKESTGVSESCVISRSTTAIRRTPETRVGVCVVVDAMSRLLHFLTAGDAKDARRANDKDEEQQREGDQVAVAGGEEVRGEDLDEAEQQAAHHRAPEDRKSTRLNSSHVKISY